MTEPPKSSTIFPLQNYENFSKTSDLFSSKEWIQVLTSEYDFQFYVIEHNSSGSFFPFAHVQYPGIEKIVSLPFSDYLLPVIEHEKALNELLEDITRVYPHAKIQFKWILPDNFPVENTSYQIKRAAYLHRVSTPDFKTVQENMSSSFSGQVKQAKSHHLTAHFDRDIQGVHEFYETYHSLRLNKFSKLPQSFSFFKNVWESFIKNDSGFVLKVKLKGESIAFAVCLECKNKLYYKFSCSKKDFLEYRPNNYLLNELFRYACENQFEVVDLGLSGLSKAYKGLVYFKESMGGQPSYIHSLQIEPDSYNSENENKLKAITSLLTEEIVRLHPSPQKTSGYSKILYPYFV